jgi:large subunit ribosomal protein L23
MIHKYCLRDKKRTLSKSSAYDIFLGPHVTEKSAGLAESNKIVLKVALDANKIDIKRAFELIFEVPVESVNTCVTKPRQRGFKGKIGKRSPFKKAVIKIQKGIDISKMMGVA